MSVAISIRLPENLANSLEEVARETERSKSFLIQKAIQQFLEEQADLQIALDRLNDNSDKIVSVNEMRQEFGL
jgi:RHH-type transcriptional regulator, rel operon repressor / antitoxin RelB